MWLCSNEYHFLNLFIRSKIEMKLNFIKPLLLVHCRRKRRYLFLRVQHFRTSIIGRSNSLHFLLWFVQFKILTMAEYLNFRRFFCSVYMSNLGPPYCNKRWGGSVRGSWGKGPHLGGKGARPPREGRGAAVGSGQWRRRDIAAWPQTRETVSPWLQETVMHRVSVIVRCTAIM